MRLIDADALIEKIRSLWRMESEPEHKSVTWKCAVADAVILVLSIIAGIKLIDAEPVRHGRWEYYEEWGASTWLEPPDLINAGWKCTNCGIDLGDYLTSSLGVNVYVDEEDKMPKIKSCPHCGAKMDAKED